MPTLYGFLLKNINIIRIHISHSKKKTNKDIFLISYFFSTSYNIPYYLKNPKIVSLEFVKIHSTTLECVEIAVGLATALCLTVRIRAYKNK